MIVRRYLQLDVFAATPGAGNPLGVVVDAKGLDAVAMQAIAAWTNLSETIFLLPPEKGCDYRVRIFTPRQELPFAGHPSVGAAWAALDQALAPASADRLLQECAAGRLPVRIERRGGDIVPHVRAPRAVQLPSPRGCENLLDAAIAGASRAPTPPALWSNGPNWWMAELADGDAVSSMRPDLPAIAALTRATQAVGLAVFGREDAGDHDVVLRAFCPADNVPEDPVTGSANAAAAAFLHAQARLPHAHGRYIASQGREVGRDGRVEVQVDDAGDVWIGGQVQAVIRGEFRW